MAKAKQQPLQPEAEQTLAQKASRSVLGGIGAVGNFLDIPGSMVRDTVSGRNPFDQLLPWNWTSSEGRTSGRDLNRMAGASGRRDNWGNFAGGLGTEILLDPLTYLSFGVSAGGKATQVLKRSGLAGDVTKVAAAKSGKRLGDIGPRLAGLTTTLDDLVRHGGPAAQTAAENAARGLGANLPDILHQPVRGLAGYGLPFRDPIGMLGTGPRAQGVAKFLDDYSFNPLSPGRKILDAKIPGTDFQPVGSLYRAMDATMKEAVTPLGRELGRGLFRAQEESRARARGQIADVTNQLDAAGMAKPAMGDDLRKIFEIPAVRATAAPEVQKVAGQVRSSLDDLLARSTALGLPTKGLTDAMVDYFPRFLSDAVKKGKGRSHTQVYSSFNPSQVKREDFLRDIPGGTQQIKQIVQDQDINNLIDSGVPKSDVAQLVKTKYPGAIPDDKISDFSGWLNELSKPTRQAGVYGNHPVQDLQAAMMHGEDSIAAAKSVYEGLTQPGVVRRKNGPDDNAVPLGKLLETLGFAVEEAKHILGTKLGKSARSVDLGYVDKAVAEDLMRFMAPYAAPKPANELVAAIDSVTNFMKGMFTSPWPAFHTRNLTSGQFQNFIAGLFSKSSAIDAHKLMRGETIKAADIPVIKEIAKQRGISPLTDESATKILGELAYAHGLLGKFQGEAATVAGKAAAAQGSSIDAILAEMIGPGRKQVSAKRTGAKLIGQDPSVTWNPIKAQYRGVGQAQESTFAPMAVGQDVGQYVEGMNRLAPFIKQLREGVDPAEAARKVNAAQVDYSNRNYTSTETQVMQRLMPFYKFSRGQAPFTADMLMQHPGGTLAQTIRATNNARDPNEMTPDYVAESASIPLAGSPLEALIGKPKEAGTNRYLTGLGLGFEDPLSFLGGGVSGAIFEGLGRTNPLFKLPMELATGQSLFQKGPMGGRPLEDMDPTVGRTISNIREILGGTPRRGQAKPFINNFTEEVLANSPISRILSTARTATDPRKTIGAKAVNLTTGLRITDVSPASQDAILRERAQALMKKLGAKAFNRIYFPKEDLAAMSPVQREQAIQLQQLMNTLAKRSKERKAAKSPTGR
ncbi:hypothetical protein [Planctomicrobium piriforme]|uniref:Large polyvalent protein associated domain-containing protein n=1 Tax=Planctomicrobium piriforme TaxID=1576369 RepID=A0A1I3EAY3_9PLAN|nr:hypothetical protein [Planctomicrobium piriforme]SFH96142.1 hypothetical protein SAMN05421753_104147 [Planctomicrobium piriforme]